MEIGMGIDAGGTFTDVVVYSFEDHRILHNAKASTTKGDLVVGIGNALDSVPDELLGQVGRIALSTTLATNACVEDKGGRGKLLFIGVDAATVDWVGDSYGLPPREELRLIGAETLEDDEVWKRFYQENTAWFADADGVAVVDILAHKNDARFEKRARQLIGDSCNVPVICGHELYNELNSLRRGASALLNVRLIPVIGAFLQAVRRALAERRLEAPVMIVRSDGSLMSEGFTSARPVETLLCGPAAGVIGSAALTGEKDSLVVDMGGTTTDISVIRGGVPVREKEGICIGKWRTFTQGVYVKTFGLGGDSTVRITGDREIQLSPRRSVPLCMAAAQWPTVKKRLRRLVKSLPKGHTLPLQEFFILDSMPEPGRYDEWDMDICRALQNGPLMYDELVAAVGAARYSLRTERLEREGVVMRAGFTPTDVMHIRGDHTGFDAEASHLGAQFLASGCSQSVEAVCEAVYDGVKKKLYHGIVQVLLEQELPQAADSADMDALIDLSWRLARSGENSLMAPKFRLQVPIAGIGAPIHIFLPDVAKALGTTCLVPQGAGVANALGAIVGQVEATVRIEVRTVHSEDGGFWFELRGGFDNQRFNDKDEAVEAAARQAEALAAGEAKQRGAVGRVEVTTETEHSEIVTGYNTELYLGSSVVAHARALAFDKAK